MPFVKCVDNQQSRLRPGSHFQKCIHEYSNKNIEQIKTTGYKKQTEYQSKFRTHLLIQGFTVFLKIFSTLYNSSEDINMK